MFLDSDDILKKSFLIKLNNIIVENKSDIIKFNMQKRTKILTKNSKMPEKLSDKFIKK